MFYARLADGVVVLHLAYVLFVVVAVPLVLIGKLAQWRWVRNGWFRSIHLAMILIVVVESWLSITCPLTTLEQHLRWQAGTAVREGSFMGRLAHDLLFFDFAPATFTWIYCLFGLIVAASWIAVPPSFRRSTT